MSNSYRDRVLAQTPVAYYRLSDSTTTAADSSGNSYSATLSGTYTQSVASLIVTDTGNYCTDFDGSTGKAKIPTSTRTALNGASAISIEAIVKADSIKTAEPMTIAGVEGATNVAAFRLHILATSGIIYASCLPKLGDTNAVMQTTTALVAGETTHLVAVADIANDTITIYKNGIEIGQNAACGFTTTTFVEGAGTNYGHIGAAVGGASHFFDGKIDEVAYYASALTQAQAYNHYLASTGLNVSPNAASVAVTTYNLLFSPYYVVAPVLTINITGLAPIPRAPVYPDFFTLSISDFDCGATVRKSVGNTLSIISTSYDPRYSWEIPANITWSQIYRLVLTGDADATTDIELPMESFQSRARSTASTYIGAVIPYTTANAAAIAARMNGTIVISGGPYYSDGTENLTEIVRALLDWTEIHRGAFNSSITLHGYSDAVTRPVQTRTMTGVSYVRTGQTNSMRCSVDIWLRPGDTAYDASTGTSIVAGSISYTIGTLQQNMTVSDTE